MKSPNGKTESWRGDLPSRVSESVQGELVTLLQIAMMGGLHYSALRDGVFSHPTLAESLNNLFMSMDRPAQAV